jgi:hypothetical protein
VRAGRPIVLGQPAPVDVVRDRDDNAVGWQSGIRQTEVFEQVGCQFQRVGDRVPLLVEERHVGRVEVLDLEREVAHAGEHERGFEDDVLRELEALALRIEAVDERVDLVSGIPLLPLGCRNREQEIAVGQHRSAGVHADEDVQNAFNVLIGFLVEMQTGGRVDRSPERAHAPRRTWVIPDPVLRQQADEIRSLGRAENL